MKIQESAEMYLETIFLLSQKKPNVRSVDISVYTGYSKPSVSRAVGLLKKAGLISVSDDGYILLSSEGMQIAEKIYERHTLLTKLFIKLGVSEKVAAEDACRIEHVISKETFEVLKKHAQLFLDCEN
jgi:Mn-dependent DtxR family transcriptional regulator